MKKSAYYAPLTEEITVIDRRDTFRINRVTLRVEIVRKTGSSFVFSADWRFPVPASKRRYFSGAFEFSIEELGKIPKRNAFLFAAESIARRSVKQSG